MKNTIDVRLFATLEMQQQSIPNELYELYNKVHDVIEAAGKLSFGNKKNERNHLIPVQSYGLYFDFRNALYSYLVRYSAITVCGLYEDGIAKSLPGNKQEARA